MSTWLPLNSKFLSPKMIIFRGIRPVPNHPIGLVFAPNKVQNHSKTFQYAQLVNFELKYDFSLDHCEKLSDMKIHLIPIFDTNSQN